MKKLTTVNDAKLLELQRKSDLDIYKVDMNVVVDIFNSMYPTKKGLNVLAMRSVLAGDTEIVKYKTRKFVLVLTSELDILDEINYEVKKQNAITRSNNKEIRKAAWDRMMQDPLLSNCMKDVMKLMSRTIR